MKRIIYFLFLASLLTTQAFGQKLKSLDKQRRTKDKSNFMLNDSISQDNSGTKKLN